MNESEKNDLKARVALLDLETRQAILNKIKKSPSPVKLITFLIILGVYWIALEYYLQGHDAGSRYMPVIFVVISYLASEIKRIDDRIAAIGKVLKIETDEDVFKGK